MQCFADGVQVGHGGYHRLRSRRVAGERLLGTHRRRNAPVHICWADDTWLLAASAEQLSFMVLSLDQAALRMAGMELRLSKCQWTRIQRQGQELPELSPTRAQRQRYGDEGDAARSLHEGRRSLYSAGWRPSAGIPGGGTNSLGCPPCT